MWFQPMTKILAVINGIGFIWLKATQTRDLLHPCNEHVQLCC